MGESYDERLANLKFVITKYNNVDQQYIADKLSDLINTNYNNVDFNLTVSDINTDGLLKYYLKDTVYTGILTAISDLKEYRALQKSLFQVSNILSPSPSSTNLDLNNQYITPSYNQQLNAQFNLAFEQQLDKNHMQRLLEEEKDLSNLIQSEPIHEKQIKLFHTLTFAEITDNLSNSIVTLFKQIYSLDIKGLMSSYDNYIYYGFTFVFIYIMFRLIAQELSN
jgi:hypothetical protein